MSEPNELIIKLDLTWFRDGDGWLYAPALIQSATEAINAAVGNEERFEKSDGAIAGRIEHSDRPPMPLTIWVAEWKLTE